MSLHLEQCELELPAQARDECGCMVQLHLPRGVNAPSPRGAPRRADSRNFAKLADLDMTLRHASPQNAAPSQKPPIKFG